MSNPSRLVIRPDRARGGGTLHRSDWVKQIRKAFYLATPHDGVALVQLGFRAADLMYAVPDPITHLIGDILNLWSQGAKDLRYPAPLVAREREFSARGEQTDEQTTIPWLATAEHYMINVASCLLDKIDEKIE